MLIQAFNSIFSFKIVEAYFNCICDKKTFVLSSRSTSELINGTFTGLKRVIFKIFSIV